MGQRSDWVHSRPVRCTTRGAHPHGTSARVTDRSGAAPGVVLGHGPARPVRRVDTAVTAGDEGAALVSVRPPRRRAARGVALARLS